MPKESSTDEMDWGSFNRGKKHGLKLAKEARHEEELRRARLEGWVAAAQFLLLTEAALAVFFTVWLY